MSGLDVPHIEAEEVKRMIERGDEFVLADVRNHHTYCKSHIKGAVSLPLTELDRDQMVAQFDKDDDIVLYCYNGSASEAVAQELIKHGFANVRVMKGGHFKWRFVSGHKALDEKVEMRAGMGYGH